MIISIHTMNILTHPSPPVGLCSSPTGHSERKPRQPAPPPADVALSDWLHGLKGAVASMWGKRFAYSSMPTARLHTLPT